MKKLIFLLFIVVFATQAFGQKKGKPDPKDAKIDSLTKANTTLTLKLDTVSYGYSVYAGVYVVLRDSVMKYNFDPARTAVLIDSLKAIKNSVFSENVTLADSVDLLLANNKVLQTTIDSLSVKKEVDINKMAADLKVLKELLDSKTITQAEFDQQKAVIMKKYQ